MSVLVIIFFTGVVVLFLGVYHRGEWAKYMGLLGLIGALLVSFLPEISFWKQYQKMFWYDIETGIFTRIVLVITLFIFILGDFALYRHRRHQSEMYALLLFSLCGGVVMLGFQNLTTLFLGIEILSIPLYILAGSEKNNLLSVEASVKYFLLGTFATGFLLFGFALIYGSSGSLALETIDSFSKQNGGNSMFVLGILLTLIALGFKVAFVPFHLWSPDVYCGAPSWITLFMASVVKVVSFYALFKLMNIAFLGIRVEWLPILQGLIFLTLLFASVLGVVQNDAKRMLAYSSIANVGYMALIFYGVDEFSIKNLAFYLLAYSFATVGVFMGVIWIEKYKNSTCFESFNGLAKSQPILALLVAISLFSMVGIPFTMGFIGKLNVFLQAVREVQVLIIIAILASVVSVAYYLKLIIAMYFRKGDIFIQQMNISYQLIALLIIFITLVLGIFPNTANFLINE